MRIVMTRHGHVEGIMPERFRGRADVPLTERGMGEARMVAGRIARDWMPAAIYSSPLKRCMSTAEQIAQACRATIVPLEDLNDLDYGDLQWKPFEEAKREYAELFQTWFAAPQQVRFPNGESLQDLGARTSNVLRLLRERHGDDVVVLVGHDSVNRAILLQLLDQPLSAYWRLAQSPCSINEIVMSGRLTRVESVNDTSHLRGA
ncbi:MAG TPA: histidine phosphatase family protein [Rhizomicrobium sp.]|jgi:probable phosphoglycerate mutase|nr:histidine phosphatase family protein [Rhizomicrobium sp.]